MAQRVGVASAGSVALDVARQLLLLDEPCAELASLAAPRTRFHAGFCRRVVVQSPLPSDIRTGARSRPQIRKFQK